MECIFNIISHDLTLIVAMFAELCDPQLSYCKNGASCLYDTYTSTPICTCAEYYEGTLCDVRIGKSNKRNIIPTKHN